MAKNNKISSKTPVSSIPSNLKTPAKPAQTERKMPSLRQLWIILAVIAFLAYSGTLKHGYVLDDTMVSYSNGLVVKGVSSIPELLTTPYMWGYAHMPYDVYRPVSLVTLAMEMQLFGVDPAVNHTVNVLLFACCIIALFLFLCQLFEGKKTLVAFIATLLFAVHPIHTEVVANVKSRDELLCFLFAFTALYQFASYSVQGKPMQLAIGAFCFLLSLLSKETSIAFVGIVPFIFFLFLNDDKKRSGLIAAVTVLVTVVFLALRFAVLKSNHADDTAFMNFIDNQLVAAPNYASRLATTILVLGNYLKLMFVPYPLICSYAYNSIPTATFAHFGVIISLLVYLGLAGYSIYLLLKNKKDYLAFGIIFFIATLAVFSNIFFLIASVMAERFLFFASVGFCVAIALLLEQLLTIRLKETPTFGTMTVWIIVAPIAIVLAILTVNRSAEWKDNYTLFATDVEKMPENARLNFYMGNEMGNAYADQAPDANTKSMIIGKSIPFLQKAVAIYPHFSDAQVALGTAFFKLLQYDSAQTHFNLGLQDDPKNIFAFNGLAGIYFMKKDYVGARNILIRDVALNPRNTSVIHNLGLCYVNMQRYDSAIYCAYKVLALDPHHIESMKNLANSYNALGQADSSKKYEALVTGQIR